MLTQTILQNRPARVGLPDDWRAANPQAWTPEDAGKNVLSERQADAVAVLKGDGSLTLIGNFYGVTVEAHVPSEHPVAVEAWARYWQANPFTTQ